MKKYYFIIIALLTFTFSSCKEVSLQSYLVTSKEKKEFSHFSIPTSILKLMANTEDEETYNSIQKINITGLLAKDALKGQYETEKLTLKNIFKNSKYKPLMNFKNEGYSIALYYTGNTDEINEIIVFAYGEDLGIGIARILGDTMNPDAIAKIINSTKSDTNNSNPLKNILKNTFN